MAAGETPRKPNCCRGLSALTGKFTLSSSLGLESARSDLMGMLMMPLLSAAIVMTTGGS